MQWRGAAHCAPGAPFAPRCNTGVCTATPRAIMALNFARKKNAKKSDELTRDRMVEIYTTMLAGSVVVCLLVLLKHKLCSTNLIIEMYRHNTRSDQGGQGRDRQGSRARLSRRSRRVAGGIDGRAVSDDGHVRRRDGVDQTGYVLSLAKYV